MSTLHLVSPSYTNCIVCDSPLGQDSRDEGYRACHAHRTCVKCNREISAREVAACHDLLIEDNDKIENLRLIHARCKQLETKSGTLDPSDSPTLTIKQAELDMLNIARLMVWPSSDLSVDTNEKNAVLSQNKLIQNMTFDQKLLHLRMIESCAANASIALKLDPKYRKDALNEREAKKQAKAEQEKLTSSRSENKPADDPKELALGTFMEMHGLTERKTAQKIQNDIERSVSSWRKTIGESAWNSKMEQMYRDMSTQALIKSGVLPK